MRIVRVVVCGGVWWCVLYVLCVYVCAFVCVCLCVRYDMSVCA